MSDILPKLRTDLVIRHMGDAWVVKDPRSKEFFKLDESTGACLPMFDGRQTVQDLAQALDINESDTRSLIDRLSGFGFFSPVSKERQKQTWHYMLWPVLDPSGILWFLGPVARLLYSRIGLVIQVLIAGIGMVAFLWKFSMFYTSAKVLLNPAGIAATYIGVLCISLLHESGHAMALTAFGGSVPEMGVILLVLVPGFYTDVSDSYLLKSRKKRLVVLIAGPLLELTGWAVLVFVYLVFRPSGFIGQLVLGTLMMAGLRSLLFNLNPLIRTDGYFVLEELLGVTNLYEKAFTKETHGRLFRAYAIASTVYSLFLVFVAAWAAYKAVIRSNVWAITYVFLFLLFGLLSMNRRTRNP